MTASALSFEPERVLGPARLRVELRRWALPAALVVAAVGAAAVLAYGTRASLARFDAGVDVIVAVRRIQWLLVAVSLITSLSLVTMVIANRLAPWWLVALAPVLVLLTLRFGRQPTAALLEIDVNQFAFADHPAAPRDDEPVVGVHFNGYAYAFPHRALGARPIVAVTDYSKRMLLMWSPDAGRAIAVNVTRDLRPRALEVVSRPAGALLVNDRRYGQFISSMTGKLLNGGTPIGFAAPIPLTKTTWGAWRTTHPDTGVLLLDAEPDEHRPPDAWPARVTGVAPPDLPVVVIATMPPLALPESIVSNQPLNLAGGHVRVLLVRDPKTGTPRAFERRVSEDLFPTFSWRRELSHHPHAPLLDSDSQSLWSLDGEAVEGPLKGERLQPIPVEAGLRWGPMKYWHPELQIVR